MVLKTISDKPAPKCQVKTKWTVVGHFTCQSDGGRGLSKICDPFWQNEHVLILSYRQKSEECRECENTYFLNVLIVTHFASTGHIC